MQPSLSTFDDSLALRAKYLRFRGVGSHFDFLTDVGIVPIKEFIYKGCMLIDVAELLNVSVTNLKTWITENNYDGEIEEASVFSAEGYLSNGEKLLKVATNNFELNKAKAMIEHGRFMASKKDKKTYGTQIEVTGGPAAVHYSFILPQAVQLPELNALAPKPAALEGEFKEISRVTLDPLNLGSPPPPDQIASGIQAVEPVDA